MSSAVDIKTNIPYLIKGLYNAEKSFSYRSYLIIKGLTNFAYKKMKMYTPNTARSTGRLRNSITQKIMTSTDVITGISYVPKRIRYQFMVERGNQKQDTIKGNPRMSFPISSWGKGVASYATNGYYTFTSVKRGKYKGSHFTEKAIRDTTNHMKSKMNRYKSDLSRSIMQHITITGGI